MRGKRECDAERIDEPNGGASAHQFPLTSHLSPLTSYLSPLTAFRRHPLRTGLSLLGIAVTTAMLLDMVLLSGGLERSFERLLLSRGFQIRLSPKGTLPFDTEAAIPQIGSLLGRLRRDPDIAAAGPVLGASVYTRRGDSLVTLFAFGIDPSAQALYELERGANLDGDDSAGVLLSEPAREVTGAGIGDTLTLVGRLDPGTVRAAAERRFVVRGVVRWLYDFQGQPSVGALLAPVQALSLNREEDRASAVAVRVREGADPEAVAARLRADLPLVEVNSVADLVARFRERLVYFRQLSYILGILSLLVTLLLVATLLTIGVNERRGEIATLRAIGFGRWSIVRQIVLEGTALTVIGGVLGIGLGLATARYLDAILTSFPGLPAAISFFVPQPSSLVAAALVLLGTGALAGLYPAYLAARAPIAATLRAEAT